MASPGQEKPETQPEPVDREGIRDAGATGGRRAREESRVPAWDVESLSETFQEKFIRFRNMDRRLRLVTILAMVGVVIAALLVAVRDLPVAQVAVGWQFVATAHVSTPLLICCIGLQALAWSLLLAGGMHAHWPVRLTSVGLWSAAMIVYGATPFGDGSTDSPFPAAAVLVVVLSAWALSGAVWVVDRSRIRAQRETHRHRLQLLTGAGCLILTLLIYAIGWLPHPVLSGLARASAEQQLFVQTGILIPAVFLTGSDFTEWAEVTAGRMGTLLARRGWLLPVVTLGVSLALVVNGLRVDHGPRGVIFNAVETLVVILVALVLARLLVPRGPTEIPPSTLIPTVLLMWVLAGYSIVVSWTLSFPLGSAAELLQVVGLHAPAGLLQTVAGALGSYWIFRLSHATAVFLGLLPVPAAVVLILIGLRVRSVALAGFFLGVLALGTIIFGNLDGLASTLGWGSGFVSWSDATTAPAALCLVLLLWMAVTRNWSSTSLALLRMTLVLSLGMQFLSWMVAFFALAAAHGEALALVQALLLLTAIGWDVATSGAAVTNQSGPRAPRHARVLLYFSYSLLAASAIAFKALLPSATQSIVTSLAGNSLDAWVEAGLDALGQPLLIIYFVFGLLRWRRRSGEQPRREPLSAAG